LKKNPFVAQAWSDMANVSAGVQRKLTTVDSGWRLAAVRISIVLKLWKKSGQRLVI